MCIALAIQSRIYIRQACVGRPRKGCLESGVPGEGCAGCREALEDERVAGDEAFGALP